MRTRVMSAAGVAIAAGLAHGQIQTVRYEFPDHPGVSLLFGFFGGDEPVTGFIVETRVSLTFDPDAGIDAANFFSGFSVPIEPRPGFDTELVLIGADMGWSGDAEQSFQLTTREHNGWIRPGRFGWEIRRADDTQPLSGVIRPGSVIEFDVMAPGVSTVVVVGAGLGLVGRRRR